MRAVNGRYSIDSVLGETENSINFKAMDLFDNKPVTLKFLNRNSQVAFPLELFKKEYLHGSSCCHTWRRRVFWLFRAWIVHPG